MKHGFIDHPETWYEYDVRGSVELLEAFIASVERQIDENIENYNNNSEEVIYEGNYPDEPPQFITYHEGLDDRTWDLKSVFLEYFPNLQRRSALITLYSFFECELNRLCDIYQATEKYTVSYRDLNGSGIVRARTYLCKVVGFDHQSSNNEWNNVTKIQSLRNLLVHSDGALPKGGPMRDYVVGSAFLDGEKEVLIQKGYLIFSLNIFNELFQKIHDFNVQFYNK